MSESIFEVDAPTGLPVDQPENDAIPSLLLPRTSSFSFPATLNLTRTLRYAFEVYWARADAACLVSGEYGLRQSPAGEATLRYRLRGYFQSSECEHPGGVRVRLFFDPQAPLEVLRVAVRSTPPALEDDPLLAAFAALGRYTQWASRSFSVRTMIHTAAAEAIRLGLVQRLTSRLEPPSRPLLDVVFPPTPKAQRALENVRQGNWEMALALPEGEIRHLPSVLGRPDVEDQSIALVFPFLDRKDVRTIDHTMGEFNIGQVLPFQLNLELSEGAPKPSRRDVTQSAVATAVLGAMQRGPVPAFGFTWSGQALPRELYPVLDFYRMPETARQWLDRYAVLGSPVQAELALHIPADQLDLWFFTPPERTNPHYETFSAVSVAVQRALRVWLPLLAFRRVANSPEHLGPAQALTAYAASHPFRSTSRTLFTYDPLDTDSVGRFCRSARHRILHQMNHNRELLMEAGRYNEAQLFLSKRAPQLLNAVERDPRGVFALLTAEQQIVNCLLAFAGNARVLRQQTGGTKVWRLGGLDEVLPRFVRQLRMKLRRIHPSQDYSFLIPMLLIEATQPLVARSGPASGVGAVMQFTTNTGQSAAFSSIRGLRPQSPCDFSPPQDTTTM